MPTEFVIPSSDPNLLEKARRAAREFSEPYMREDVIGVVLLGAVARGYFDQAADIDVAIFREHSSEGAFPPQYTHIEGLEIQCWLSDYESELPAKWDMPRRWTYSQGQVIYDPAGKIARLLKEKVPLKAEERKWLLMSGAALSEWYVNRLTRLWRERGNLVSAHHMFDRGLDYYFDMLFALNDELVADTKWKYYCVERLARLPAGFRQGVAEAMVVRSLSVEELDRRRAAFMSIWQEMLPLVENELQMPYSEFSQMV